MRVCLGCQSGLDINRLHCQTCKISYEGHFLFPRLARLDPDHMQLAETFLLTGGSLKNMAQVLNLSYPTLRKRVDEMVAALEGLKSADEENADTMLRAVEQGTLTPEEAARKGGELRGIQ
jgi:hypothetical protein